MAALRGWSCYWGLTLLAYGSSERVVMLLGLTLLAHGSSERVVMLLGADSAGTWQL